MGPEVVGTLSAIKTKVAIDVPGIVFGDPLDWLTLMVGPEKRICGTFDDCTVWL